MVPYRPKVNCVTRILRSMLFWELFLSQSDYRSCSTSFVFSGKCWPRGFLRHIFYALPGRAFKFGIASVTNIVFTSNRVPGCFGKQPSYYRRNCCQPCLRSLPCWQWKFQGPKQTIRFQNIFQFYPCITWLHPYPLLAIVEFDNGKSFDTSQ